MRAFGAIASVALVLLFGTGWARAQTASPKGEKEAPQAEASPAKATGDAATDPHKRTFYELRITLVSAAARWSPVSSPVPQLTTHAKRSVYFGSGIGTRIFIKQPHHGLLVDFDYRIDTDVDTPNLLEGEWKVDFAMAQIGYAYRFLRRANERMVWAFTPHASFSAGGSINRSKTLFPTSSAVIGGRVGFNVDLHIRRFFFGWAVVRNEASARAWSPGPSPWARAPSRVRPVRTSRSCW